MHATTQESFLTCEDGQTVEHPSDENGRGGQAEGCELAQVPEQVSPGSAASGQQTATDIDAMLFVDPNGRKVIQNQRLLELFMVPPEVADSEDHLHLLRWIQGLAKDQRQFEERTQYLSANPGKTSRGEIDLLDGRTVDAYSSPVVARGGECCGRLWTFRDITESSRTAASLRLFRELIDRSSDSIYVIDPVTARFLDVNESGLKAVGYPMAEMLELAMFDVVVGLHRTTFNMVVQNARKFGRATMEVTQRRKDGTAYGAEVSVSVVSLDREYVVAVMRDISRRRETDAQMRLQSAALEAAANGIVITDSNGVIQWANEAFSSLTGYGQQEAVGKKPSFLKSGRQDPAFYESLWKTIRAGVPWKGELVNRRKDGSLYNEEMTITPIRGDGLETTHFVAVKQDVTRRKLLESEIIDVSRRAGMSEVATGVLHNIGNVLNSVNVSATLLRNRASELPVAELDRLVGLLRSQASLLGAYFPPDDARVPMVVDFIAGLAGSLREMQAAQLREVACLQKNTDHLKEIVAMHQGYAGRGGASEILSVPALVDDALAMCAAASGRDSVRISRDFDPGVPQVTTERHKVMQILVDLIRNAQAACSASERPDGQITLTVSRSESTVNIAVADNGVGISFGNLTRIFGQGATARKDGHGFGLHNSANAASELGGTLRARSDGLGHGAEFTLVLPVRLP